MRFVFFRLMKVGFLVIVTYRDFYLQQMFCTSSSDFEKRAGLSLKVALNSVVIFRVDIRNSLLEVYILEHLGAIEVCLLSLLFG